MTNNLEDEPSMLDHFNNFISSLAIYGTLFIILTFNLSAVSTSLYMNYEKPFNRKIGGAIFAFFFGPIYIVFNYYLYRILQQGRYKPTTKGILFPWT